MEVQEQEYSLLASVASVQCVELGLQAGKSIEPSSVSFFFKVSLINLDTRCRLATSFLHLTIICNNLSVNKTVYKIRKQHINEIISLAIKHGRKSVQ